MDDENLKAYLIEFIKQDIKKGRKGRARLKFWLNYYLWLNRQYMRGDK